MNSKNFLEELYKYKNESHHILIWLPGQTVTVNGRSHWFKDIELAANFIKERQDENIYFQVGLANRAHGPTRRCSSIESEFRPVVAMPALFCDIDVKHRVHKNQKLPKTRDEAMQIIKGHGWDPSMIVDSGHGLQAYWIFKEVWGLPTPELRLACAKLLTRLKVTLKTIASGLGWHVDSVQDLVRVLRPVGSCNCKNPLDIKKVRILENSGFRYDPEEIEEMLPDFTIAEIEQSLPTAFKDVQKAKVIINPIPRDPDNKISTMDLTKITDDDIKNQPEVRPKDDGTIVLDVDALPPLGKLVATLDEDLNFKNTWNREDMGWDDNSQSSYDMSIAHQTVKMDWNDQEIANLIIAFRRLHCDQKGFEKALRKDYILNTILKAREFQEKKIAEENLESAARVSSSKYKGQTNPDQIKNDLYKAHGIKIIKLVKYCVDDPYYRLHTTEGVVELKNTGELITAPKLRARVAEYLNVYMPYDPKKWHVTAQNLLDLREEDPGSAEERILDRLSLYMTDYLHKKTPKTVESAVGNKEPFVHDGHWYIHFNVFYDWAKTQRGEDKFKSEMVNAFRDAGFVDRKFNVLIETSGKKMRTTYRAWKVPQRVLSQSEREKGKTKIARENFTISENFEIIPEAPVPISGVLNGSATEKTTGDNVDPETQEAGQKEGGKTEDKSRTAEDS